MTLDELIIRVDQARIDGKLITSLPATIWMLKYIKKLEERIEELEKSS